jgi:hypothetical protein
LRGEAVDLDLRTGLVYGDGGTTARTTSLLIINEACSRWPVEDEVCGSGGCYGQGEESVREQVD